MKTCHHRGFTLIEVLVALAVFGIVSVGASWILITSLRSNTVLWEQLETQNHGRRVLQEVVDMVRRAEDSSIGSYSIAAASSTEFIFYANIDDDASRERIRLFLDGELFRRGVIHPTGTPLSYDTTEDIVTLADAVKNIEEGTDTFLYYDASYTGTEAALAQPVTTTDIRAVRVQLELEEDPTKTPVPLFVDTLVQIRNLKDDTE